MTPTPFLFSPPFSPFSCAFSAFSESSSDGESFVNWRAYFLSGSNIISCLDNAFVKSSIYAVIIIMSAASSLSINAQELRGSGMNFTNEFATPQDIDRYKLKELWNSYHPNSKGEPFLGRQPGITIDRKNDVWLLPINQGIGEYGNRTTWILYLAGVMVRIDLDLVEGTSQNLDDRPFNMVWNLGYVKMPQDLAHDQREVLDIVKEAISVYGYRGVKQQVPETRVVFDF